MVTRIVTLIFLIFLMLTSSLAQGYFPLSVGNIWRFNYEETVGNNRIVTETVTGDTVLPNGKTYAVNDGTT